MASSAPSFNRGSDDKQDEPNNRRARRRDKRKESSKAGQEPSAAGSSSASRNEEVNGSLSILGAASKDRSVAEVSTKQPNGVDRAEPSTNGVDRKGKGRAVDVVVGVEVKVQNNGSFEDGEDFIAFEVPGDVSDEGNADAYDGKPRGVSKRRKQREKENGSEDDHEERERPRKRAREERERDEPHSSRGQPFDRVRDEVDRFREDHGGRRESNRDRRDKRRGGRSEYRDEREDARRASGFVPKKSPWIYDVDLDQCQNVAELLHREVESFVDWVSPTPIEDEIRGLLVQHISRIVKRSFPDAQVHPFGSYQTKLYLPEGDIDLVIISDSMAYADKTTVLHTLANALKRAGITSRVTVIAKARVPIIKFTSTHGRFKIDISINQQNGLVSGNIISGFLRDMVPSNSADKESKALRSLVMITKAFLSQRSLNEVYTGGLGSYSVVCLAVSFLQMHPKIRRGEIDPEKNLGVLVMEFFELYGVRFNYDEVGISLREGGTYFSKRQRGWQAEFKRNLLSVEDPADPSNDISSGSYNFHKVRTAFAGAHGILTSTAYLRAEMLGSRRDGRSFRLRDEYHPEDLSLLTTVMGITQETINHRRLVKELYDERTLHRIMGVQPRAVPVTVVADGEDSRPGASSSRRAASKPSSSARAQGSSSLNGVDTHAHVHGDAEPETDDEMVITPLNGRHHGHGHEPEDDEGRYAIGRPPPRKRRRNGTESDNHTVIFVDDDEDDDEEGAEGEREEGEYASMNEDEVVEMKAVKVNGRDKAEKMAFWLAKGKTSGSGGGADEDSH